VRNDKAGVRILVFGASAAYGEMFSPFTAFPGIAEARLRAANPDIAVEVLNLAHGGMGSRQVGEMVFRALENDKPDLIVVYTGNNEYHELRALKARSDRYDPGAELLRRRLSRSFVYRQLREWFVPTQSVSMPTADDDWLPIGRMDVTVDADDRALGLGLYADHLSAIIVAAAEHGVPLLLTTVATNIKDHIDNATPGEASLEESTALQTLSQIVEHVSAARFAAEAGKVHPHIKTEGGYHKLGMLYLSAGLVEVAADAFAKKELAALRPMTANRDLRAMVRQLGARYQTPVCDLAGALATTSPDGLPGNGVFIDHCHPNALGHARLGQALAQCIAANGFGGLSATPAMGASLEADTFRLDHYAGHRRIPGYSDNPVSPDTKTAEGAAIAGHQAFVAERFSQASTAYKQALKLGGPPGALNHNLGLVAVYSGDLEGAMLSFQAGSKAGVKASTWAGLAIKH